MPITCSALPAFAFCRKNPINVELISDDYLVTPGINGIAKLTFLGTIAANTSIRLIWAEGDITLTAKNIPDDSGFQFPAGNGGIAHINAVIAALQVNYYLDRDFELALAGSNDAIFFTAKKSGVLYNILPVTAGSLQLTVDTVGQTAEQKLNFAHHLEVWLASDAGDQKIYDENLQLEPNTGRTVKDISSLLEPYFAPNVIAGSDKPSLTSSGWQACTNSIGAYYIKYAQYFGDIPQIYKVHTSAPAIANYGGLDIQAALNMTLANYLQPGGIATKTRCLRQGSIDKRITAEQPEWLYWLNLSGAAMDIKLRVDIYYLGGSSSYFNTSAVSVGPGSKNYIAVGYKALDIAHNATSGLTVSYYSVRVVDSTDRYQSLAYTYTLDLYRLYPRYFVYLNSLGGYQTLYTWGEGQPETDITKEDVNLQTTYDQAATIGSQQQNNIRLQAKETVYTGYRSLRDIRLLNDFLVSPEKYLVSNGRLIPISTETDNLKQPGDGNSLNGASFIYQYAYQDSLFTDDVNAPDSTPGVEGGGYNSTQQGYNAIIDDGTNDFTRFYQST